MFSGLHEKRIKNVLINKINKICQKFVFLTFINFEVFSINEVTPSFEFMLAIRVIWLLLLLLLYDNSATNDGDGGNGRPFSGWPKLFFERVIVEQSIITSFSSFRNDGLSWFCFLFVSYNENIIILIWFDGKG